MKSVRNVKKILRSSLVAIEIVDLDNVRTALRI